MVWRDLALAGAAGFGVGFGAAVGILVMRLLRRYDDKD